MRAPPALGLVVRRPARRYLHQHANLQPQLFARTPATQPPPPPPQQLLASAESAMFLASPFRRALARLAVAPRAPAIPSFAAPLVPRCYSSSSPSDGSNKNASNKNATPAPPRPAAALLGVPVATHTPGRIPYVPSTAHLRPADVALSAFFAQHRPLSIDKPLPVPTIEIILSPPPPQKPVQRAAEEEGPWDYGNPFVPPPPPQAQEDMLAISVKRQRKLKMKKHKYKKLMKKTRNLRRRIERQKN